MKRSLSLLLCALLLLSLAACSAKPTQTPGAAQSPSPTPAPSIEATAAPTVEATTEPSPAPTEKPKPTVTVIREPVFSEDFESGESAFHARGSETIAVTTEQVYEGTYALSATGRTETWHGPEIDLSEFMSAGNRYEISAWVKFEGEGSANQATIYAKYVKNGSSYLDFASVRATKGEWVELTGTCEIESDAGTVAPYFETEYGTNPDGFDLYIDNIVINKMTIETVAQELPVIHEVYTEDFSIGVAVSAGELRKEERAKLITTHFNSMTMGNEMKPDSIIDIGKCASDPETYYTEPALKFGNLDIGMQFARENGIPMRGHTLLWHSQTPTGFFTEDYTAKGDFVSAEVMLLRLESYIKQVLTYCQTNYPGVVYAWDVVNEAIETNDNTPGSIRKTDSLWYEVVGESYVEMAFTFARKYADPGVKLFYNDFNCFYPTKMRAIKALCQDLYDKGILDGIGMQSHIAVNSPTTLDFQYALESLGEVGCEIQITELDVSAESDDEEAALELASRYKRFMSLLKTAKKNGTNITNVTLWGLSDDYSWLNKDGPRFPLLFDQFLSPKPAFWGFVLDESIPLV